MSLDRKLDIAGVVLALLGLLTLLVLVSSNRSSGSQTVLNTMSKIFGWGAYALPLAMIVVGLWLVLRNFERIPRLSLERVVGLGLLFGTLLTTLHFSTLPNSFQTAVEAARQGRGGGFIGAYAFYALQSTLGIGGGVIALLALLVIALALALDVPVVGLFGWTKPLVTRLQDAWKKLRLSRNHNNPQPAVEQALIMGEPLPAEPPVTAPIQPVNPATLAPATINWSAGHREWALPHLAEMLDAGSAATTDDDFDRQRAHVIEETLASFGAPARVVEISRGPTITLFGVPDHFATFLGLRAA